MERGEKLLLGVSNFGLQLVYQWPRKEERDPETSQHMTQVGFRVRGGRKLGSKLLELIYLVSEVLGQWTLLTTVQDQCHFSIPSQQ